MSSGCCISLLLSSASFSPRSIIILTERSLCRSPPNVPVMRATAGRYDSVNSSTSFAFCPSFLYSSTYTVSPRSDAIAISHVGIAVKQASRAPMMRFLKRKVRRAAEPK